METLTTETIKKYQKKTIAQLRNKATEVFNKWIRERDKDKPCISCSGRVEQAGHFYSAGHYARLRYVEDNVHGQCIRCNYYKHGNLIEYRAGLVKRIGLKRLENLDNLAKLRGYKYDRFFLIEIIENYKITSK